VNIRTMIANIPAVQLYILPAVADFGCAAYTHALPL
jgi:hypothetical protein